MKKTIKKKYDFPLIKKDFFLSEFNEVKGFFQDKYGTYNGQIRLKTTGWGKEKIDWKIGIVEKTLDSIQDKEARENARVLLVIMEALRLKVTDADAAKILPFDELQKLWEIFMTMNGKITKITKEITPQEEAKAIDYSEDARNRLTKYTEN